MAPFAPGMDACYKNLQQIGLACRAYATDDDKGYHAPSLATLAKTDKQGKTYLAQKDIAGTGKIDTVLGKYVYFGIEQSDIAIGSETALAADRVSHGGIFHVLCGDGHVSSIRGKTLEDALKAGNVHLNPPVQPRKK